MTPTLINTPYGPKTPELLCKAMDAYNLQPELLDALKAMTTYYANDCRCKMSDRFVCIVHRTKKVIAKAEGRAEP